MDFKTIDALMDNVSSDATRSKLPELGRKLIELTIQYGEAKQNLYKAKSDYDREFCIKKESWKMELERLQNLEVEKDPKFKRTKITNTEIEHYSELELLSLKKEQEEPAMLIAMLEPYLRSVESWIQSIKFIDKSTSNINF